MKYFSTFTGIGGFEIGIQNAYRDAIRRREEDQARETVSMTYEGRYSLTLQEYCKLNNLDYSSLKTLKDCSVTPTVTLSEPSSRRLMNWGMTVNGKCLTAKIAESPRIGSASSLSDILEEHPDPKYFLSEKMTDYIMKQMKQTDHGHKPNLVQQ